MAYLLNLLSVGKPSDGDVDALLRGRHGWARHGSLADSGAWIGPVQEPDRGAFHLSIPLPADTDEWTFDNHAWKELLAERQLHVPRWDVEIEVPHWAREDHADFALVLARGLAESHGGFVYDPVERVLLEADDSASDMAVFMEFLVLTNSAPDDAGLRRIAPLPPGWRLEGSLEDEFGIEILRGSDEDTGGAVVSVEAPEEPDDLLLDDLQNVAVDWSPEWSTRVVCSYAFGTDDGGRQLTFELVRRMADAFGGLVYDTDADTLLDAAAFSRR